MPDDVRCVWLTREQRDRHAALAEAYDEEADAINDDSDPEAAHDREAAEWHRSQVAAWNALVEAVLRALGMPDSP